MNVLNARPVSKGQYGYQYSLNASLNEVTCHGVPSKSYRLKAKDILNVDITMHEEPQVLHYGRANSGLVLEAGMTFTIEPMINQGVRKTKTKKDGWTVVTKDKKLSAQWEHTVLVTDTGFEVLTLREDENI